MYCCKHISEETQKKLKAYVSDWFMPYVFVECAKCRRGETNV